MEKYELKKLIKRKLNIPITPENVYTNTTIGKQDDTIQTKEHPQLQNSKYLDELYSAAFMDDYFS